LYQIILVIHHINSFTIKKTETNGNSFSGRKCKLKIYYKIS